MLEILTKQRSYKMTNSEILQAEAIKNYSTLDSYQKEFIDDVIRDASKKDLRKLTSKQYKLLRSCAK